MGNGFLGVQDFSCKYMVDRCLYFLAETVLMKLGHNKDIILHDYRYSRDLSSKCRWKMIFLCASCNHGSWLAAQGKWSK
ncbi:hypothetical protein VNO77_36133 [Canavalia gladiata]|uniref:Uncharacterized protein n=1 Tax=Canavalia gladiata TaxID=3824 RepID=A0AAN9K7I6_CANGL